MAEHHHDATLLERLQNEDDRVLRVIRALGYSASAVAIIIGLKSWLADHHLHAWTLFIFAFLMGSNCLLFDRTQHAGLFRFFFLVLVSALFLYLIASGGESRTGHLWFYVFPPFVFYIAGPRGGAALMVMMLAAIVVIFRFPELPMVTATYESDLQIRFFFTIGFTTVFTYVLDQSRRKAYDQLAEMATLYERAARTDELTRLPNRRDMKSHLEKEYDRYRRHGSHFSVILVDIDHFKKINDTYGHDAGDYILVKFAEMLQDSCRKMDIAARWGGEEFLILLPDTSLVQALAMAERFRKRVETFTAQFKHQSIRFTTSCGVCSISQTKDLDVLMKQADVNLYQAKMKGRNMVIPLVVQKSE